MRILQLSYRFPYPPKDGGAIGIFNITKGLSMQGHEVTVLCVNTPKHYFDPKNLPAEVKKMARFIVVDVDTTITALGALANLFSSKSYHCSRFDSPAYRKTLEDLLQREQFDIVQFEGPFMEAYLPAVRELSRAKVTLRMHNVEHIIWQRQKNRENNPFKKLYLDIQVKRLQRVEMEMFKQVDGLFPITEVDQAFLNQNGIDTPNEVVPASIDLNGFEPKAYEGRWPDFCFLGGLDWMPNQDGIRWFLSEVWPAFLEKYPEAEFHLAGRNAPESLKGDLGKGVIFHGEVGSATDFLNSHGAMIVPLFSGSGMRIKIIEGLALEKPIISTSIGSEGMEIIDREDYIRADSAGAMLQAMVNLAEDRNRVVELGKHGAEKVRALYGLAPNAQKMSDFYRQIKQH